MASLDDLHSKPDTQLTDEPTTSQFNKQDKSKKKKKSTRAAPSNNDKRKASTVADQTRGEAAAGRDISTMPTRRQISLAQAAQLIADAQFLMRASRGTSENSTQSSATDPLATNSVDSSSEAKILLQQIKKANEVVNGQTDEASVSEKKEETSNRIKQVKAILSVAPVRKPGERNLPLEKKFSNGDGLDLGGTADLSSLNVIDSDILWIIERVFRQENTSCVQLILRDNYLTAHGVKLLVDELLRAPTKLRSLILSNNAAIGDIGIEHCARLIQASRSLTLLGLHYTGMTDRSVRILADVLCREAPDFPPARLEKLYISFNQSITDDSFDALVQILEGHKKLKTLGLQRCNLSDDICQQLKQVAIKNKKKLSLSEEVI